MTAYEIMPSLVCFVFFFKQKTAYEIMPSLVGSEMCIRDSHKLVGFNFLPHVIIEGIPVFTEIGKGFQTGMLA